MTNLATIAAIMAHTPIWVWALYALLLFLGFQRTRDSVLALWRMLILPIVVALLTLSSVIGAGAGALPATVIGVALGGTIGWQFEPEGATRREPDGRVWVRGEWVSFFQLLLVLLLRYALNVVPVLSPTLASDPTWSVGTISIASGLSALFLGRTAARIRAYLVTVTTAT